MANTLTSAGHFWSTKRLTDRIFVIASISLAGVVMPYFIYEISPERKLTYIEVFDDYKSAKSLCRDKRKSGEVTKGHDLRMVFAKNKKEAEGLLKEKRKPSTPIEEWEV